MYRCSYKQTVFLGFDCQLDGKHALGLLVGAGTRIARLRDREGMMLVADLVMRYFEKMFN
jgi:hypothetical protein